MVTPAKEQEYLTRIHTQDVAINQLKKQNELLQQQVNALTEILIQMRKDKFGSKSEKTKVLDNQLNFFNEPEMCADLKETEPIVKIGKKGVSVRARKVREEALKDLPIEVHEYDLPDNEMTCPQCSHTLKKIGSQFVRNIIVNGKPLVPCNNFAELVARRFAFRILVCFCNCPADLQTTASRTADKCLVHLHREAGFVPKDTACIQQVSGCWLLLSQLCCTEFRCSWLRSWYRIVSA